MKSHTEYLWFETKKREEFVRITDDVAKAVQKSGVIEGMALVSAMHITAAVYVNDWEDGLIEDIKEWLAGSRRRRTTATTGPARTTARRT